ncbi:Lectin, galactoside-binding, soluble, 9 (galectin 9)-like 1 [Tyrophagus putrescentiae]|nr:Lectin, galactoside-binding, soluble, 9 (galectin 9)-like 1 [Tyrophagus putrescentiae]
MDPSKYAYYPGSLPTPYAPPPNGNPPNHQPPPPYHSVQPPYNPSMYVPPPPPPAPVTDYKITVRGRVKTFAMQFAIDVVSNGRILLHMNPRFLLFEETTVFNSYTDACGWGAEERRHFRSLKQGENFVITIQSRGGFFYIDVNGEKYTYQKRISEGPTREVKISKVKDNDVNITAIEITPF